MIDDISSSLCAFGFQSESESERAKNIKQKRKCDDLQQEQKMHSCRFLNKISFTKDLKNVFSVPKNIKHDNKIMSCVCDAVEKCNMIKQNQKNEREMMLAEDNSNSVIIIEIHANIETCWYEFNKETKKDFYIRKINKCMQYIEEINNQSDDEQITTTLTLLKFYKYVNYGKRLLMSSIKTESKTKDKMKRKNEEDIKVQNMMNHYEINNTNLQKRNRLERLERRRTKTA